LGELSDGAAIHGGVIMLQGEKVVARNAACCDAGWVAASSLGGTVVGRLKLVDCSLLKEKRLYFG